MGDIDADLECGVDSVCAIPNLIFAPTGSSSVDSPCICNQQSDCSFFCSKA